MSNQPESPFITREEAARILRVTLGTLDKFVKEGTLPKPGKLHNGRRVYFRRDDFLVALNVLLPPASESVVVPQPGPVVMPRASTPRPTLALRQVAEQHVQDRQQAELNDGTQSALRC